VDEASEMDDAQSMNNKDIAEYSQDLSDSQNG
jgi:hypothetical protein